jgi:DNA polymerase III delta prime subunit
MRIPDDIVLLLSGVPATGKSSFARALARDHNFTHYDLECYPQGWPDPCLKVIWDADPARFVAAVKANHRRVALDWGFPVRCLPIVQELRDAGAQLFWFNGEREVARRVFVQRGGIAVANFDTQLAATQDAQYPWILNCPVVETLAADGTFLSQSEIEQAVFR